MFQRVLIVDDYASVNRGVSDLLISLGIKNIEVALYCDDAYLKIRKANDLDKRPFDLLITDLSFREDHRECKLKNGQELVKQVHLKYPEISIIIYSQEDNFQKVRKLVNEDGVIGYVCKSRTSEKELELALQSAWKGTLFLSKNISNALRKDSYNDLTPYEKVVVRLLSQGLSQPEMSIYFKNYNISPSSLSSIEKCINRLKDQYNANNATHLVALLKDKTLI